MSKSPDYVDFGSYLNTETLDLLVDLMDGDQEMICDLVDTLLETTPDLLKKLEEGVSSKNADQIRNSAHALKSSNAQLGAEQFAKLCGEMESKGRSENIEGSEALLEKIMHEFKAVSGALDSWKESIVAA